MEYLATILEYLITGIEVISTLILLTGFFRALKHFLLVEYRNVRGQGKLTDLLQLRREIGSYILLGLDFYIISDIISSMVRPELNELINLAIIVVLRTTIGYFLGREIAELAQERSEE